MFLSLRRPSALIDVRPPRVNDSSRVIVAHYLVPVKPSPVTPVPAATLVLLRDRSVDVVEVLLIRRHGASKFAAGDFVFPGGKIELSDGPADAAGWCRGVDAAQAARALRLGTHPTRRWVTGSASSAKRSRRRASCSPTRRAAASHASTTSAT